MTWELCEECKHNEAEWLAMLEHDENPARSVVKYLCGNCLHLLRYAVIEAFTRVEVLNWD